MKSFITPAGKEIQTKRCEKTQLLRIEFATGGELPTDLSGYYTSEKEVERVIIIYLAKVKNKVSK